MLKNASNSELHTNALAGTIAYGTLENEAHWSLKS
jgi:hypothetical protein